MISRRSLLKHALLAGAWYGAVGRSFAQASSPEVLGQGDFKYRLVPGWGVLDEKTPVNDCHGLAHTADGHIVLLTNHVANNVIFFDEAGKLAHKWTGPKFPGAHGLSLATYRNKSTLFITDLNLHTVTRFAYRANNSANGACPPTPANTPRRPTTVPLGRFIGPTVSSMSSMATARTTSCTMLPMARSSACWADPRAGSSTGARMVA